MERAERAENDFSIRGEGESGDQGESAFHRIKVKVADQMSRAALAIHQKSQQSANNQELSSVGHRTAEWLERSADYVREMEPENLKSDLEDQVRRNPGRSLLIAGITGLALGVLLRRR